MSNPIDTNPVRVSTGATAATSFGLAGLLDLVAPGIDAATVGYAISGVTTFVAWLVNEFARSKVTPVVHQEAAERAKAAPAASQGTKPAPRPPVSPLGGPVASTAAPRSPLG